MRNRIAGLLVVALAGSPFIMPMSYNARAAEMSAADVQNFREAVTDTRRLDERLAYRTSTVAAGEQQLTALRAVLDEERAKEKPDSLAISSIALSMYLVESRLEVDRLRIWELRSLKEIAPKLTNDEAAASENARVYASALQTERARLGETIADMIRNYDALITDPGLRAEFEIHQKEGSR